MQPAFTEELKAYWASWANGNINSAQKIIEFCDEFQRFELTPLTQNTHKEGNLAKHTILVCEAANELVKSIDSKYARAFRFAALLHDVGKPLCGIEIAPHVYAFPDANKVSSSYARIILDKYIQISTQERELIVTHIWNIHMPSLFIKEQLTHKDLVKLSLECDMKFLFNLVKANYMGRMASNLRMTLENMEKFKAWFMEKDLWEKKTWDGALSSSKFKHFGRHSKTAKSVVDWFYLTTDEPEIFTQAEYKRKVKNWQFGTLYITVGPPGSGKSTWVKRNYSLLPVISSDAIRLELCGDVNDQSKNVEVFDLAHQRIEDYLKRGKKVVFDATNLSFTERKRAIDIGRRHGAHIVILFFGTRYQTCLSRVLKREEPVFSQELLDHFYAKFDYVSDYEYDKIIYI